MPEPLSEQLERLAKDCIDRSITRLRNLHDAAGRPAWDQVVQQELRVTLDYIIEALRAKEGE